MQRTVGGKLNASNALLCVLCASVVIRAFYVALVNTVARPWPTPGCRRRADPAGGASITGYAAVQLTLFTIETFCKMVIREQQSGA